MKLYFVVRDDLDLTNQEYTEKDQIANTYTGGVAYSRKGGATRMMNINNRLNAMMPNPESTPQRYIPTGEKQKWSVRVLEFSPKELPLAE